MKQILILLFCLMTTNCGGNLSNDPIVDNNDLTFQCTNQDVNTTQLPFSPIYNPSSLPFYIESNDIFDFDTMQKAADYWNELASATVFVVDNNVPTGGLFVTVNPNDQIPSRYAAWTIFSSYDPEHCKIETHFDESNGTSLVILKHELGHCLGFGHSTLCSSCLMVGDSAQGSNVDCDLNQLYGYLH